MERLTYKSLKETGYRGYLLKQGKEKIIQFGLLRQNQVHHSQVIKINLINIFQKFAVN